MVVKPRNTANGVVFDIFTYEEPDKFELMIDILILNYKFSIFSKTAAIATIIYLLNRNNVTLNVVNDEYGKFIKSADLISELFIYKELVHLNEILK